MSRKELEEIKFKLSFEKYSENFHALPLYAKANGMTFYRRPNGYVDEIYDTDCTPINDYILDVDMGSWSNRF